MMFPMIIPALITDAVVGRMRFKAFVEPKEELVGLDITPHGESAYPSFI